VCTVANYWKQRIAEEFQIDAAVIPAGVDEAMYCEPHIIREKYGLEAGRYILFLGRIDPIKRVEWVARLETHQTDVKIVIAGGAHDEATRKYLTTLYDSRAQTSEVIFTGFVFGREKAELLTNCLAFVNPSSSEGMPIAVLEAMSYRRCCIASDIPAHKEVIRDGETGYLFTGSEFDTFQRLVNVVLSRPRDELQQIGLKAHMETANNYNWERTAELTEQMYRELINA
jgi:glycosyltransferase involved in cell wall biosynthesis